MKLIKIVFQANKEPGLRFIKKNTIEVKIHPDHKVDDTFGYENWVLVSAKFSTLRYELMNLDKSNKPNKIDYGLSGQVILLKLTKSNEVKAEKTPRHNLIKNEGLSKIHKVDDIMADQYSKDIFKFKK